MQNSEEWDRFMRFMERYAETRDLNFSPSPTRIIYDLFQKHDIETETMDPARGW